MNQLSGIEEMQGLIDRVIMVTVRDITGCGCGCGLGSCPPGPRFFYLVGVGTVRWRLVGACDG